MIEAGILDPTKVTRTALQNAASIAGLMITTEAMVAERRRRTPGDGRRAAAWAAWAAWISDPYPPKPDHEARPRAGPCFRVTQRRESFRSLRECPGIAGKADVKK